MENELCKKLIYLAENYPEKWSIDEYHARIDGVSLWIANRPYADLRIEGSRVRVGNWWSRKKLRRAIDNIRLKTALKSLNKFMLKL